MSTGVRGNLRRLRPTNALQGRWSNVLHSSPQSSPSSFPTPPTTFRLTLQPPGKLLIRAKPSTREVVMRYKQMIFRRVTSSSFSRITEQRHLGASRLIAFIAVVCNLSTPSTATSVSIIPVIAVRK